MTLSEHHFDLVPKFPVFFQNLESTKQKSTFFTCLWSFKKKQYQLSVSSSYLNFHFQNEILN